MSANKLFGRVTVEGDKLAATAVVELHNSAGDVVDQVQVDDDGRYTYHLSPGTWSLNAWDAHGHRATGEVTLSAEEGEDMSLDLDLQEEGRA